MARPFAKMIGVLIAATWAALHLSSAFAEPAPRRVVSLNPCLDAILLEVADPGQIVALSHYSRSPSQSAVAAQARRFPFTWGSGEEIVALKPDLVIDSGVASLELARVLPRLHIREEMFGVPSSVEESLAQVSRVAALVGHPERGAALNARIRAAIAAAAPGPGEPRLRALIYEYHGLATGPHTLTSDLMGDAGFDNLAAHYGLKHTLAVPLEQVIADPPQVLLSGRLAPNEPRWADRILSHPALAALAGRVLRESFPEPLTFCGGPVIIPAMAALAKARINAKKGVSQ